MSNQDDKPFRMRIESTQGSIKGTVSSGTISVSDAVKILPQAINTTIHKLFLNGQEVNEVATGSGVELILQSELEIPPGSVICARDNPVQVDDQFEVEISWTGNDPLFSGRPYTFNFGNFSVTGSVTNIKYKLQDNRQAHLAATKLEYGEACIAAISIQQPVPYTPFEEDEFLGSFTISEHISDDDIPTTNIGSGHIKFALRRASNIHRQALDLDRNAHANLKKQKPCVLWLTGLSGSGKSTIANALETILHEQGRHTFLLDGDNVRHGLNRDLGFTDADRVENIRRISEVAKLMTDAGLIVITSFISPFISERQMAREMMSDGEFFEIHVDAPLEVCEKRDEKGLYAKARAGEIKNFTGIDSAYEAPLSPELSVNTANLSPQDAARLIVKTLKENNRLP